jgi:5-carboxymethyl-2-hydroxymuconic-semialdehyde dehydrogenase
VSTLEQNLEKLETYIARFRKDGILNRIGGEDRPALSGATFDNHSPVDESFICKVAKSGADDIDAAAKAAKEAFPPGAISTP